MTSTPLSDIVSSQYSTWIYPEPIEDIPNWLENNWQWFDPSHSHRMFWPGISDRSTLDILVAGCGTNQAAIIAYTNPTAQVVAVDVSRPSLGHHQYLKNKYHLKNLELHQLPIEEIHLLDRDFDLIISTGVLHHLASPEIGIKALSKCLRLDGVMALMLYTKFGRLGVEMMQGLFRDLGFDQSQMSVSAARDVLSTLTPDHPIKSYMSIAPDLQYDAGLVDTFLHGRERTYTVTDCIELVNSAGLVFQDMFLKAPYYPLAFSSNPFYASLMNLSEIRQYSIMERINFRNGCHFFTACRSDRPSKNYKIDFSENNAMNYVPSLRHRCKLNEHSISRYDWTMNLDSTQSALLQQMDGQRTIREITLQASLTNKTLVQDTEKLETLSREIFHSLWRLDFLAIGLQI